MYKLHRKTTNSMRIKPSIDEIIEMYLLFAEGWPQMIDGKLYKGVYEGSEWINRLLEWAKLEARKYTEIDIVSESKRIAINGTGPRCVNGNYVRIINSIIILLKSGVSGDDAVKMVEENPFLYD